MHDYQLEGIAAPIVVRLQPVRQPDARRRLLPVPATELDGRDPDTGVFQLQLQVSLAHHAPALHREYPVELRLGECLLLGPAVTQGLGGAAAEFLCAKLTVAEDLDTQQVRSREGLDAVPERLLEEAK